MTSETKKTYIHFIIGTIIMFAFRFIPEGVLPNVTPVGLQVMGVFIGTIYLWSTIDPLTSSAYSIVMLALTDFAPAAAVLQTCFGNPTVVQLFFLMIYMAGLTDRRLTIYIARWLMTRKMVEGRPWVFTFIMLFGSFLISAFINAFTPIMLFWPVLYGVFEEVGFKKTDKYPKLMLIGIVVAALIGFPVPPYMSNGLALLGSYRALLPNFPVLEAMEGVMVSNASYWIGCFTMGILLLLVVVAVMKFIFRPDVSPLKNITIEMLNRNPLPPMTLAQKIYGYSLAVFIFIMLMPTLLPNLPVLSFLNKNSFAISVGIVCAMVLLRDADGSPVLRFGSTMGQHFAWPTYFLCTAAILIGGVLTNEATGITAFLNTVLGPMFNGMSGLVFTFALLLIATILTNICNSLVIGMILQPVVLTFCAASGVNPAPIITLLTFTVLLSAACTPAASPFAAMLFGNKEWLSNGDVYKYATTIVVAEFIVIMVIGVPFINILV